MELKRKRISSFRMILISFAVVILLGTLLLMLPISNESGCTTNFIDALFTATSSVCVTGLIVFDTATYWSSFGEAVIIVLIQIGGLGVVTVAIWAALISGRKIGLYSRSTMQEAIGAQTVGGIVKLTMFILKITLCIELIGAILMLPTMVSRFGLRGIWMAFFHSVSAFCNAGFDLMGDVKPFSSLAGFGSDIVVNVVIMALIISGGIGFLTWQDIKNHKFNFKKYRLQSKVILITSLVLIIFPAVYFFFAEFSDMPLKERILYSLFQAVTPRTAGFNTYDLSLLSPVGIVIMIMLMIVGGSPGSTAGGMKTTTLAVLTFSAVAVFRKREHTECFGRRIEQDIVRNAAAILLMYIILFITGSLVISSIEGITLQQAFFETASAVGTVGLSLGLTPTLGIISKIILILLMFFGRAGGLTVIFAALVSQGQNVSKYPQEKIAVG